MHFFRLELYTTVKMSYSMQWFEDVQINLCTFTMVHRELMHLCITLNGYTASTVLIITFSLMPVDSMHFSVHHGIKIACGALVRFCTLSTKPMISQCSIYIDTNANHVIALHIFH